MIEITRYTKENKDEWDSLITKSRVDTFLFYRDFLDYHSDRFIDHSFMIFRKGKLEAVLPGNVKNKTFISHQGITYGGLITTSKINTNDVIRSFELINEYLRLNSITEVIYKPLPAIYHKIPAQEDIYALFKLNATKIGCNISSTIFQSEKISFIESRKSGIRKAKKGGAIIIESEDFSDFWEILDSNLKQNHGAAPVHNLAEISRLKSKFYEQIKLFICLINDEIVGGCVLFIMQNIVHVQYISANEIGKQSGAIDYLFDELINNKYKSFPIFDFGHSNEQMGILLNENLIFQKEGFGGRGTLYETYKYSLNET